MAFADPQSVLSLSLPRVSSGVNSGSFSVSDSGQTYKLDVSHSYGKRTRRLVSLTLSGLGASPIVSGTNVPFIQRVYLVSDTDANYGVIDPATEIITINGLTAWLTASTNANALRLAEGQN